MPYFVFQCSLKKTNISYTEIWNLPVFERTHQKEHIIRNLTYPLRCLTRYSPAHFFFPSHTFRIQKDNESEIIYDVMNLLA